MSAHLLALVTVLAVPVLAVLPLICLVVAAFYADLRRVRVWPLVWVGIGWAVAVVVAAIVSGYAEGLTALLNTGR